MRIYFLGNEMGNKIGGGWSFLRYISTGNWEITMNPEKCDIYFVTSVSMLDKVSQIPFGKKKIILRVDNILKDSTNRRLYGMEGEEKITRMEAMKQIAQRVDAIIWQSSWAKEYISPFIGKTKAIEKVIMNGVNEDIFNPDGPKLPRFSFNPIYLYVRSSNHDNKQWHQSFYEYSLVHQKNPNAQLWIAGRFSPENSEHNFDFFQGENYKYWGMVGDQEMMVMLYRSADYLLYSFYNDACSQTLVEGISCGIKPIYLSLTGGAIDIKNNYEKYGTSYLSAQRMNNDYKLLFEKIMSKQCIGI